MNGEPGRGMKALAKVDSVLDERFKTLAGDRYYQPLAKSVFTRFAIADILYYAVQHDVSIGKSLDDFIESSAEYVDYRISITAAADFKGDEDVQIRVAIARVAEKRD